jgi:hypothetical protein
LLQTAFSLLFGLALIYVLYIFLAPWNFYFGGHFHAVPGWTGRGWIHAPGAGGDYYLWLRFNPTTPGRGKSPLRGLAYLCTPRGEKYRLNFGGMMTRNHGTDLRGVPIHLYLYNWPLFANLFHGDRRPRFDLYGTFGDSQMTLDDHGSLARAFKPDGTLVGQRERWPWNQQSVHLTLAEDSLWATSPACPVPK